MSEQQQVNSKEYADEQPSHLGQSDEHQMQLIEDDGVADRKHKLRQTGRRHSMPEFVTELLEHNAFFLELPSRNWWDEPYIGQ